MVNDGGARTACDAWMAATALAVLAGLSVAPAGSIASAEVLDRAVMIEQVAKACPALWAALPSAFLGGNATVHDPWNGSTSDREDFMAYLAAEMAGENLTAREIESLAGDPMVVIAECSHQKLRLARYLAAVDAEVAISTVDTGQDADDTTNFPDGRSPATAATSCEAILEAWPDSDNGEYWIDPDGGDTANAVQAFCQMTPDPDGSAPELAALSCQEIKVSYPESATGVFWLDVDGGDTANAFTAWCDMSVDGGGWTLVAAQFEEDQLTDWGEGIQADYDPTLASGKSFTFDNSELPAHAQTAFGKSLDPTFVDYVDYLYTPFDLEKTLLIGKKTGKQYHVHRDNDGYGYGYGDPEGGISEQSHTIHRMSFDETGGRMRTWSYSPNSSWTAARGYSMLGNQYDVYDDYAWTVWVR